VQFSRPTLGDAEAEAVSAVISSGWIVGGPRLAAFESRFALLSGTAEAVGTSSWTTGAFLALHALGIRPGDEVLVPSLTFIASVNVIVHAGATPVFVDVEPDTFNIDPRDAASKVSSRTRAILPVDQLGLPCDIHAINRLAAQHGLTVIEDAACAFASRRDGVPVGADAPVAVFSLHARKVVTTGEGGMVTTDDPDLAARLRRLRHQGMSLSDAARHASAPTVFEDYPEIGYNFRLTDIQAAIGLCQLDRMDGMLRRRREIATAYSGYLDGHPHLVAPFVPSGAQPNWQSYMVVLRDDAPVSRNELMDQLWQRGIPTRRGVMASHLEAPYAPTAPRLPVTERLAAESLLLPMHAGLSDEGVSQVLDALDSVLPGGT
jgi:perosamine synthetase